MSSEMARSPEKQYNRIDPQRLFPTPEMWNQFAGALSLNLRPDERGQLALQFDLLSVTHTVVMCSQ